MLAELCCVAQRSLAHKASPTSPQGTQDTASVVRAVQRVSSEEGSNS